MLEPTLSVAVDGAVTFTYRVRNGSDEPVTLAFSTSQRVEVEVEAYEDDDLVWRFSDGRMFAQTLGEEEIGPGESFAETVTWDDPETGRYVAVASLAAADADAETRAAFEV